MERLYLDTPERMAAAVRQRRAHLGWSPSELATRAHTDLDLVTRIEAAQPYADLPALMRLLRAVGIEPYAVPLPPEHVRIRVAHGD